MQALALPAMSGRARAQRRGWAAAMLLAGCASQAGAAPTGNEASGVDLGTAGPSALEEVVVHARRREEKIKDVPLSITVETGRQLEEQSAVTFEDAVREAPNVLAFKSARSVSALEVSMRGQTAIPSSIVYDPAVGLYIDGVYVANGQAGMGTLLDIDSVEIVRGAQGTLFGRNNTGGSIAFNTHRPEFDNYSALVSGSAGNQHLFGDRAIVNLPVSDTVALRFAYQLNEHDGWGSSIATGQTNFMNEHRYQWRAGAITFSLAGRYEVPIAIGRFCMRADYSWRDQVQFNVLNDFNNQAPVGLLNARTALTSTNGDFELALFATNLTDKRYAYNGGTIVNPGGAPIASWQAAADRRLYGVEGTYQLRVVR